MRKIIIMLALCCSFVMLTGQQLNRGLHSFAIGNSPSQQLIEQSVRDGIIIIQQSYELADSVGNTYGIGSRRAFSVDYSVGLKIGDGIVVNNHTIVPWDYNSKYSKYRAKYTPIIFETKISPLKKDADYRSIAYSGDSIVTYVNNLMFYWPTTINHGEGFILSGDSGLNEGWLVWITKKHEVDLATSTDLTLSVIKKSLVLSEVLQETYPVDPLSTSDEILGAFFVKTEITGVGRIVLRLCGMAEQKDGKWVLCCPFVDKDDDIDENYINPEDPNDETLTPNTKKEDQNSTNKKTNKKNKQKPSYKK